MKRIFLPVICLLIPVFPLIAGEPVTLSLDSCYRQAERAHPLSNDGALIDAATALRVKNLTAGYLPGIDFGAQATWQSDVISIGVDPVMGFEFPTPPRDQYKLFLDMNQVLFDGGLTRRRKEVEKLQSEAEKQQVRVSLYQLRSMVNQVFFTLLLLQEQDRILMLVDTLLRQRLVVAESSVMNGMMPLSGLKSLQVELLKLEQEKAAVFFQVLSGKALLGELLDTDPGLIEELAPPEISPERPAEINRPEIEWFGLKQQELSESALLLRTQRSPRLTAFAQAGYGRPGLNMLSGEFETYALVGARISWKVFDWNQNRRERQILTVQSGRLQLQEEAFMEQIRLNVIGYHATISKLNDLLEKDREIIRLRQEITGSASSMLDEGTITATEYLLELNAEKQSRIEEKIHQVQLARAVAGLKLEQGGHENHTY